MKQLDISAALRELERIAAIRGVGKMEIYRRLEVNPSTYSRWSRNLQIPSLESWQRVKRLTEELGSENG